MERIAKEVFYFSALLSMMVTSLSGVYNIVKGADIAGYFGLPYSENEIVIDVALAYWLVTWVFIILKFYKSNG